MHNSLRPNEIETIKDVDYAHIRCFPDQSSLILPIDTLQRAADIPNVSTQLGMVQAGKRPFPLASPCIMVCGGDSLTSNQFLGTESASVRTFNDNGVFNQGLTLAGVDVDLVVLAQGGIGAQVWIDTFLSAALTSNAQVWAVLIGTNDINQGGTAAALWALLQQIYAAAQSVGAYFVDFSTPPIGDDGTNHYSSKAKTNVIRQINALKRAHWAANPFWGRFVDTNALVSDATQYSGSQWQPYKTGWSYDQVHQNNYGGYQEGLLVAPIWQEIFPRYAMVSSQADYVSNDAASNQIFQNPMLLGTGGGQSGSAPLTGSVPSNFHVYCDDAQITGTTSITTANSGIGNKLVIVLTVTGSPTHSSPKNIYIFTDTMTPADGHKYRASCRLKVAGSVPMLSKAVMRLNNSGAESAQIGSPTFDDANTQLLPATSEFLRYATAPKRFTSAGGLFTNWQLYFGANGTYTIEIEQMEIRDLGA